MHRLTLLIISTLVFISSPSILFAQEADDVDVEMVEAELKKSEIKPSTAPSQRPSESAKDIEVERLTDLGKLSSFSEVSVLQKRYMPKTGRFQFFGGLSLVANDPWFLGTGLNGRVSYGFTEAWGVELVGTFLTSSQKDAVKSLSQEHSVDTSIISYTKGYVGADVMWTPIYGKLSLFNKQFVPFDMYFSAGGGTSTISGGASSSAPTFHLGMGQIFAFSKSMGFRWDVSLNNFSAKQTDGNVTNFNNLFLTLGMCMYIPEAKYR
ncbi:MAG: hypothetical protein BroJett040_17640 [Oligoflexia bacterium]|nr:MAG: hypothetical protein BroJett040_17640 [Oligoflexia bacterium]